MSDAFFMLRGLLYFTLFAYNRVTAWRRKHSGRSYANICRKCGGDTMFVGGGIRKEDSLYEGGYNRYIVEVGRNVFGNSWDIVEILPNTMGAMHDCALFAGTNGDVFVKVGTNSFSRDQFTQEAWGLAYINKYSGIKAPQVYDVVQADDATLLIMEAIDVKPVTEKKDWYILGEGLAELHRTTAEKCGLETHTYLGVFKQDNTFEDSWEEFFARRRLRDTLQMAIATGNVTAEVNDAIERLIAKVPELCGPKQAFSLLHGDPWIANLLYDGRQLVLIDCSIYYGNREIDLSTVDFFRPVSQDFFEAYHATYPIDPGFEERRDLWRVNQWLGHITLFGKDYYPQLLAAVNKYV